VVSSRGPQLLAFRGFTHSNTRESSVFSCSNTRYGILKDKRIPRFGIKTVTDQVINGWIRFAVGNIIARDYHGEMISQT